MKKFFAAAMIAVTALSTVAADSGDDTIWFRVVEGEDCASFQHFLAPEAGGDESACGYLGGLPLDGAFESSTVYSLEKGATGFALSGDQADGQITVHHSNGAVGGGMYEIALTLKVNGKTAGTTTAAANTGGVATSTIDFTMDIDPAFAGVTVDKMSIDVVMGGYFVASGYMNAGADSFINLPRA